MLKKSPSGASRLKNKIKQKKIVRKNKRNKRNIEIRLYLLVKCTFILYYMMSRFHASWIVECMSVFGDVATADIQKKCIPNENTNLQTGMNDGVSQTFFIILKDYTLCKETNYT